MVTNREKASFTVMGDIDSENFSFVKSFTYDELTELLERNPRVSMQCDWMTGEMLKNGWDWVQDGEVEYTDREDVTTMVSYDDYLELMGGIRKIHRGVMFARLHGSSVAVFDEDYKDFKIWHKSSSSNGYYIFKSDIGDDGQPKSITLQVLPPSDEPLIQYKPSAIKTVIPIERCRFFFNPKKGEVWGGTPSSKLIAHTAVAEELTMRLAMKHGIDIANDFMLFKNVNDADQAALLKTEYDKRPLKALYVKGIEMEPMSSNSKGSTGDYKVMADLMKDYMACGMRVSRQAMDGAPEGTLSSAEINSMISYAVIKEMQQHWKSTMEEIFRMLGFENPNIEWMEPEDNQNNTDKNEDNTDE